MRGRATRSYEGRDPGQVFSTTTTWLVHGPRRTGLPAPALTCALWITPARGHRLGQNHSCCVNCLKYPLKVHPPCDLSDEHRGDALWTQLLVHTQEVDFHHPLHSGAAQRKEGGQWVGAQCPMRVMGQEGSRVVDAYVSGNGADEADQLLIRRHAHSAVPLGEPARWTQSPERAGEVQPQSSRAETPCGRVAGKDQPSEKIRSSPFEKVWRIVESEHVVIILDVVLI